LISRPEITLRKILTDVIPAQAGIHFTVIERMALLSAISILNQQDSIIGRMAEMDPGAVAGVTCFV
jgi:hypothetical protein